MSSEPVFLMCYKKNYSDKVTKFHTKKNLQRHHFLVQFLTEKWKIEKKNKKKHVKNDDKWRIRKFTYHKSLFFVESKQCFVAI